ncbi:MAG TPA: hypothetical protein VE640_08615 [Candidatus Bathyarchaeia archaeon]|nr:hypothetical protein [Candidatus Bathyarchaeia archaeon]
MTASEFAFLALGLILGVASGAALVELIRARPPGSREIRVTVAPNSIRARRSATLSDDAFSRALAGPATGGPGDRRVLDAEPDTTEVATNGRRADDRGTDDPPHGDQADAIRTPVHESVAPAPAPSWASPSPAIGTARGLVAVPMSIEPDPITKALRSTADKVGVATASVGAATAGVGTARGAGTAREADRTPAGGPSDVGNATATEPETTLDPAGGGATSRDGPCADERRLADERCSVAARAREGAAGAAEALRSAQRAYDAHVQGAESGAAAIDPRSVRTAKEIAQRRFRDARTSATTRDEVEAAAREWLREINEINHDTRDASQRIERHRAAAFALAPVLERLAVEADAARISAERADEACLAAREAVAACDEARTLAAATAAAPARSPNQDRIAAEMPLPDDEFDPAAPMGSRAGEDAVLIRILRGDREAMLAAVARLSGDDPDARGRWQAWLSGLAEALIARSIEASAFDFPLDHPFWGPFSQVQSRDIAAGLSSLGYRFDGFGGWVDDRIPSQRDLSMAVGYAGEDPMRIRRWPTEPEMHELFADVRVAADEYVADTAGGLTLGELLTLLGRRADALADLWNEWGTARPILLSAI